MGYEPCAFLLFFSFSPDSPSSPPQPPTALPLRKTKIRIYPALLLTSTALPCVGVSFSVFLWRESSSNFPPASPICSSSSLLANSDMWQPFKPKIIRLVCCLVMSENLQ
ncbi:hypothetical protein SLEP1_g24462 [Rubroshorea leprosula]|uniref:Uncharacterized protein n=1 Tax=Rubroshorea leprosula TaxID=152421 RepID=A0AAV5JN39_9ROSI|nr:hypothetical protein SLEP1_g24462 [Rubroshorea leprosula]